MSRFSERVERDLRQIADRATPSPSSTAWDAVQSRIADQVEQPEAEIIVLDEDRPRKHYINARVAGAAAALILVVVGLVALTGPDEVPSGVVAEPEREESATTEADGVSPGDTAAADVGLLNFQSQPIPAGRYRVETLGAPFLVDVPDGWDVQLNELGFFVIGPAGFFGPENPGIVMMRPSNLADPSQPGAPDDEQADDWPLDDIEGWVDALVPGVVDGEPVDTTVGGLDAVRFDVALSDDVECGDEFFGHGEPDLRPGNLGCIGLATNRDVRAIDFYRNPSYRVWWIDGGDEAPIVISVGDGGREFMEFIEQAEAVLDTMTFESVGPNPIPRDGNLWESGIPDVVPAGTVTLPVGPGVTFDMSEPHFIFHQDDFLSGALVQVGDRPVGQTDIFFPDQAFDGQPLATVDEVVGALERQRELTATVIGTREVSGYEATEVNIESSLEPGPDVSPPLGRAGQSDVGWIPQPNGTLWAMETPDGLAVITTGWARPAGMEPAQAFAAEILDSIVIGS